MALADAGASVSLVARTRPEVMTIAAKITASGGRAVPITADVTSTIDVENAVAATVDAFGPPDIVVNNAGTYGPVGSFLDLNLDEWWAALDVNLGGALRFTHAVAPHMIARGRGKIVNLSGGGATSPLPQLSAYSVSKTAVVRFTENLAEELKPHRIDVNAIAPGAVETRMQDELLETGSPAGELYQRIQMMKKSGTGWTAPTVAAELVVFLASSASDGLTGKLISAPHDPWREWAGRGRELSASPMYTLRRLDPFTLRPLMNQIG
jgi:3-oxoacyl-[acyl-carrier protein] reductase